MFLPKFSSNNFFRPFCHPTKIHNTDKSHYTGSVYTLSSARRSKQQGKQSRRVARVGRRASPLRTGGAHMGVALIGGGASGVQLDRGGGGGVG
jgi:hypothetical protein